MARLYDDSLYAGSARYYAQGRLPYPSRLAQVLAERLTLRGDGLLVDLGCGPGSLTLLLAPLFRRVVAVDADAEMVAEGARLAHLTSTRNVTWVHGAAEDVELPATVDVITLAQSFHWMDRDLVASRIRGVLGSSGVCVHVGATTHQGVQDAEGLPHPAPPRRRIHGLVEEFLGPGRRAGQTVVAGGQTLDGEDVVFRRAGLVGPQLVEVPCADLYTRTEDQVVASVLSLSSSAPHLYGDRLAEFVGRLRALLRESSPAGLFSERLGDLELRLWRSPG